MRAVTRPFGMLTLMIWTCRGREPRLMIWIWRGRAPADDLFPARRVKS
jgi:hypothetical protein